MYKFLIFTKPKLYIRGVVQFLLQISVFALDVLHLAGLSAELHR